MSHGADSLKSILFALFANAAIAVAKLVAAIITGSGAMMAESIHSFADAGNQSLLILGLKLAKSPPSEDYPLGYGKAIYFWSFIVAIILFSLGGMFSLYEGWHKLGHPEPLSSPLIAIGVLVFAIVAEGISMWGCLREVNKVRRGRSYWRWFRESRQSELLVVFGEDLAALAGLVFALCAITLTLVTGNPVYDAAGTMVIGTLLLIIAILIGNEVRALLIGQSADPVVQDEMKAWLKQRPEIQHTFRLVTMQMGADIMVAIKAQMKETGTEIGMIEAINSVEAEFKKQFPGVTWLFFEPDNAD
ncbi:cation diffusion facilitator family transporter [Ketobacter sp. MCCC 1A13808]|uniref:cation diffusion facilitator family transporter n=1 Tax=Ketobacter sp. MCCC 1A13808 TaxID=2602738 RepID=UPI0012EC8720|nr:cation diffusion facilitator family transporter [Ketobacter sp. MCCC 1A13808]MVF11688.1 cation diffusion facilitator family transporter [Ketobacter sp. MCCC 1A13808]